MKQETDVSVLGMGGMGSACARALIQQHKRVTVWNRTAARAENLASSGARVASTAAEALKASPLSIMAVTDHAAALCILSSADVVKELKGKVLLQTTTGRPKELCEQRDLVIQSGGRFLGGVIMTYPRNVGRPHAIGICAGDSGSFEEYRSLLQCIANFRFLGSAVGAAVGAYMALGAMMMGTLALFFETAAVARHFGVAIDDYFLLNQLTWEETADAIRDSVQRISTGDLNASQVSVDSLLSGMPDFMNTLAESGISISMTEAIVKQLELTRSAGGGAKEMAFMTEALCIKRRT